MNNKQSTNKQSIFEEIYETYFPKNKETKYIVTYNIEYYNSTTGKTEEKEGKFIITAKNIKELARKIKETFRQNNIPLSEFIVAMTGNEKTKIDYQNVRNKIIERRNKILDLL